MVKVTDQDDPQLVADLRAAVREVLARERAIWPVPDPMRGGHAWRRLWVIAVHLGCTAIGVPEEAGGLGFGLPAQVLLGEELGPAGLPGPLVPTRSAAAALTLARDRTPEAAELLEAIGS